MDLDSVVDELYGLDPGQFVSERDDRSRQARQAGDRELATAIKALRKPSASAWAVNLLARERGAELEQLLHLGEQLRQAQATLSADQLRQLGRQRHQVVAGLTRELGRLARDHGVNLSNSVAREVEETLEAALADPEASAAVRSGRLLRSLSHAGLDPVDLDGAVAASPSGPAPARPSPARAGAKSAAPAGTDELKVARDRKAEEARRKREQEAAAAEEDAAEAVRRADDAAAALKEAGDAARRAAHRTSEAERAVQQLEKDLAEAREQVQAAATAEADAKHAEEAARDRADAADRAASAARQRAGTLRSAVEEA